MKVLILSDYGFGMAKQEKKEKDQAAAKAEVKPAAEQPVKAKRVAKKASTKVPPAAASAEKQVKKAPAKKASARAKSPKEPDILELPKLAKAVSPVKKKAASVAANAGKAIAPTAELAAAESISQIAVNKPQVELSPVFKKLADPVLPELKQENRARLQMQTPTRLYFYWSLRSNPWQMLSRSFGDNSGYSIALKLTDLESGLEEVHAGIGNHGNWWFDAEPGHRYRAEIGLYAAHRPYIRILFSNTVETPRRSPSSRPADQSEWRVTSHQFADVLDASGFKRDAIEVALAGDDLQLADHASLEAIGRIVGTGTIALRGIGGDDIRRALVSLAAGTSVQELRSQVSKRLFSVLQSRGAGITSEAAIGAINASFGGDTEELIEEQLSPQVYGASLVNFSRTVRNRSIPRGTIKYAPVSSPTRS